MKTLGERLKYARESKRYTQINVAKKLGISNGAISGYERNYRDPDTDTLKKLAELYGVSPNWLLGKNNTQEDNQDLPESAVERIVKETESLYGVNLQDDPVVLAAMRQMIVALAQAKKQR